jgi:hypothetical protein
LHRERFIRWLTLETVLCLVVFLRLALKCMAGRVAAVPPRSRAFPDGNLVG